MYGFFESLKILSPRQFGFRTGFSTIDAIAKVIENVVESLEVGHLACLTLCDLSKAFDCVPHKHLLDKLEKYGVRGVPLQILASYLTERKQCVEANGISSSFRAVRSGVPQGSVLGPLLFVIYINDLYQYLLPVNCVLYADDTTLISSDKSRKILNKKVQQNIKQAESWFSANQLKLNSNKTKTLVISSNRQTIQGNTVKLLGITIDDSLNWKAHVEKLCKKLSCSLFALRRMLNLVDIKGLLTIYHALIHSHLAYGTLIWGNSTDALRAFRMQKRSVRLIGKAGYREHCQPLFKKFEIMPLPCIYIYQQLLAIHKKSKMIVKGSDIHSYSTRYADHLRTNKFRLDLSKNNSLNIKLYNVLSDDVKKLCSSKFKQNIKSFLHAHCFYSVDKYFEHF